MASTVLRSTKQPWILSITESAAGLTKLNQTTDSATIITFHHSINLDFISAGTITSSPRYTPAGVSYSTAFTDSDVAIWKQVKRWGMKFMSSMLDRQTDNASGQLWAIYFNKKNT